MAENLYLNNFSEANIVESSQLSDDVAAAAVSAPLRNVQNLAINDYIVLGQLADEQAEKIVLTAVTVSSQTIGFAAIKFAHDKLEEVTKLFGNKIRVYRAADVDGNTPGDDDFILIQNVDIDVTKSYTPWNDSDGGVGYWYKVTYYNSQNGGETDIAESPAVRGGNFGHYATVEQIRLAAGFKDNTDVIDETIAEARDEAEGVVKGYLISAGYYLPLLPPYPASVVRLVKQLGAAFLLQDEYGDAVQGSDRDGYAKEKSVVAKMEAIQAGKQKLLDVNKETITPKKDDVSGWPDESTETTAIGQHGGKPKFTMGKRW
jgi:hypothetical protein